MTYFLETDTQKAHRDEANRIAESIHDATDVAARDDYWVDKYQFKPADRYGDDPSITIVVKIRSEKQYLRSLKAMVERIESRLAREKARVG